MDPLIMHLVQSRPMTESEQRQANQAALWDADAPSIRVANESTQ